MRAKINPPTPNTPSYLPVSITGASKSGYSSFLTSSQPSRNLEETFVASVVPRDATRIQRKTYPSSGVGEGKTSGGRPSVTPWGKITKGQPTKKNKLNKLIVKKRKN